MPPLDDAHGNRRSRRRAVLPVASLFLCLGLLACRTATVERLSPVDGGPLALRPEEGVLVVDVDTLLGINGLAFTGFEVPRTVAEDLQLVVVRAGHYAWEHAESLLGYSGRIYPLDWVELREFDVVAGQVNYPGTLVMVSGEGNLFSARFVNRSAAVLQRLRERFPSIASQLPIRYTGTFRDDFLEEYSRAEERLSQGREEHAR